MALVDKSGIIIDQMGMHNITEMVMMEGSLCVPTTLILTLINYLEMQTFRIM
jgi:hypothetical protein